MQRSEQTIFQPSPPLQVRSFRLKTVCKKLKSVVTEEHEFEHADDSI